MASTAAAEGALLVTNDTRLRNRATEHGIEAVRPVEFVALLRAALPD